MKNGTSSTAEMDLDAIEVHGLYEVKPSGVTPLPCDVVVWEDGKWKVRIITNQQKQGVPHE